jgi:DNA-binding IclR family transcriptional regulator
VECAYSLLCDRWQLARRVVDVSLRAARSADLRGTAQTEKRTGKTRGHETAKNSQKQEEKHLTVARSSTATQGEDSDSAHAARLDLASSSLGCVLRESSCGAALLDPTPATVCSTACTERDALLSQSSVTTLVPFDLTRQATKRAGCFLLTQRSL